MPPAEIHIDEALVRALLHEQHPDLSALTLVEVGEGWDNKVFRLGEDFAVRLPRRKSTAILIEHEQRWLPGLAARLPLPIPAPVRVGHASALFPWPWSIVRWLAGHTALASPPGDLRPIATALGQFLRALHQPAPADAPHNPVRSIPLDARTERLHQHLDQLRDTVSRERVLGVWDRLVVTPRWPGPPMWIHGDLHPANLLINDGQLRSVLDFGDIASGDPATDFAVMWMMFAPEQRIQLFSASGRARSNPADEQMWRRARGWALAMGVAVLAHGGEEDQLAGLARRTIEAALIPEA